MSRRVNPEAAAAVMRAAGLEPLAPYPGAQPQWLCECAGCGNEVTPRYANIKSGWGGCPACRRAKQSADQLGDETAAVLSMRAAGLEPQAPYPGRQKPWPCQCLKCGKQVLPRLNGILAGQGGCKWCAPNAPVDPQSAAKVMWDADLEPLVPYPGAGSRWPCRCTKCDAEVSPSYNNVRIGHAGCEPCSIKIHAGASQRLTHELAATAMRSHGLEPLDPYKNSVAPWRCRCGTCDTEVTPSYSNVNSGWGGCSTCRYIAQGDRQRTPEETAVAVMIAAGVRPLTPFRHSNEAWPCRCLVCGKAVSPTLGSIKGGQGACKWCANHAVDPAEAEARMRAAGLEPLVPYPGSHNSWSCRCQVCLRVVTPSYGSIRSGQGGCRWCAHRGFDIAKPSFVYLLVHQSYGAAKVGIGNADGVRLDQHRKYGWEVAATVHVPGVRALAIEKHILGWWRNGLALPPYLSKGEMPQGGWTETIDADAIDIPVTIARIRALAAAAAPPVEVA